MSAFRESRRARRGLTAVIGIAVLLIVALAAGQSGANASPGSARATLSSLLFVNPLPNYPQWRLIGDCMKGAAQARGVSYSETGPTGGLDVTQMIQEIQQGISNKNGAIVTWAGGPSISTVLTQAQGQGIVTGTMYGPGGAVGGADVNAGVDWAALGKQYVASLAGRKGVQKVAVMAQSQTGIGLSFYNGIKAAAKTTHGHVVVSTEFYTQGNITQFLNVTQAMLTAHPEVNVIMAQEGSTGPPVTAALKAKHLLGKVVLLGNGWNEGGLQAAQAGVMYRGLLQNLCYEGRAIANAVINKAEGQTIKTQISIPTVMASLKNYKVFLNAGWM